MTKGELISSPPIHEQIYRRALPRLFDIFSANVKPDKPHLTEKQEQEFEDLYQLMIPQIYSFFYARTWGDINAAEDFASQTFTKALRRFPKFVPRFQESDAAILSSKKAWLFTIAVNLDKNRRRDNSRKKDEILESDLFHIDPEKRGSMDDLGDTALSPEDQLVEKEKRGQLMSIVDKLSNEKKYLIVLKFTTGLTNEEIGKILGNRSEGAIKALYYRTLEELKKLTKDEDLFPD